MEVLKLLLKSALGITLLFTQTGALAQALPSDSALIKAFETDELLPMLIDSAIKNSGVIKSADANIELWQENEKINKKAILNGISFVSSYNYGTTGDISIGSENGIPSQLANFSSSKSDRYNIGISLQLPLGNLLARKNIIRTTRLQQQISKGAKESNILYLKQEILHLYQEMKLAHKLMLILSNTKQVTYVNYSLLNKSFKRGDGDIEQLSRLQEFYNKACTDYEGALNRFQTNYLQLEMYTGIALSNLLSQIK